MVRPGLRRSEIDWENVDIHISREEMEREQEHEAAIQQAKQYLIKNFPKFCMRQRHLIMMQGCMK